MRRLVIDRCSEPHALQPFVLNAEGGTEPLVNLYLSGSRFRGYAVGTQKKYALSMAMWLTFCDVKGKSWRSAEPDDVADFKFWRMSDPGNVDRVVGSTFHADLAAIDSFYDWVAPRYGISSPIVRSEKRRVRNEFVGGVAKAEPAGVRDRDVKWLDPKAVARWIDMGLRGLSEDGRENAESRNRVGARDAAYAQLLYGSGLRAQEGGSLLLAELPPEHVQSRFHRLVLAAACAKGKRGRRFWLDRAGLDETRIYIEGQRAEAVARAQAERRYEKCPDLLIALGPPMDRRLPVRWKGKSEGLRLDSLGPSERMRLFFETDRGLEPAMVWLNEDGRPRPFQSWNSTFAAANKRLTRAGYEWFTCTPHMLRHSFALRWYAVARLLWDRRLGHLTEDEQHDFREQFGDTWQFVQTLLGHRHPQTTANIYLEPFQSCEVDILLECAAAAPVSALIESIFESDRRVVHDPVEVR